MDNETWRWGWTVFAAILAVGEVFIPGFLLLPFAVGAAAAAALAWLDLPVSAQLVAFFGFYTAVYIPLRRYVRRQADQATPAVGANRWDGAEGFVVDTIDPENGVGTVRVFSEEWRATAAERIESGNRIVVLEVAGTRMVVEQRSTTPSG